MTAGAFRKRMLAAVLILALPGTPASHAGDARAPDTDFAGDADGGRVIGGHKARKGEWPWQVKILAPDPEQRGRFAGHCGGALIAPRWILTAAHCFSSGRSGRQELFARDLLIVEGKSKVEKVITVDGADKPGLTVETVIVHEDFDRKVFANDIALVKLAEPASSRPVALAGAADGALEAAGRPAVVTGWGYTKADHGWDDKYLPTELQEVEIPIVARETCRAAYRESSMRMNPIDGRSICAGLEQGGKDACQGDSGGPLVAQRPDRRWAQLGIVSWGAGCAEANRYGVYSRVAAFRDWIAEKTGGDVPAEDASAPAGTAAADPADETPDATPSDAQSPQAALAADAAVPDPEPPAAPADETQEAALSASGGPPPDAAAAPPAPAASPGDRALLVGIDDYRIPEARLSGSARDVEAMRALLVGTLGFRPDSIHTLVDRQASREAILDSIDDWLVRQSLTGGRIFFYFSGQGSEEVGGGSVTSPTLVAADAELSRGASGAPTGVTGQIRESEIAARLNGLKDRRVTVVVDACHVGPGSRGAVAPSAKGAVRCLGPALASLHPPAREGKEARFSFGGEAATVWSAVDAGQWAFVDAAAGPPQGVFTRRFIEGVRSGAGRASGKPGTSNAALLDYVRRKSAEFCRSEPESCRSLTPQFYGAPDALGRDVVTGEEAKTPAAAVENTLKTDNEAGVSVDVLPGTSLKIGERIAMRVSSQKPGYLIIVDIDAAGKLTQLYPNKRSMGLKPDARTGDNRLDPARPVTVPDARNPYTGFEYAVEGPAGVGMVVAVLSDRPVAALDLPDVPATLAGQRAAFNYVYDLARNLRIVGEGETGAKGKWSFDSKFYRIR